MGHRATFALIGGGGFTHAEDPELEDFLLSLCGQRRPKIGYVGAANNDDPERIERFHARFKGVSCVLSHFPHAANPDRFEAWAKPQNLIYFSGGDTLRLRRFHRAEGRGTAVASRLGIPVHVNTFSQVGASCPVTAEAALTQVVAETLAGVVLAWAANRKAKVIFGPRTMVTDLRTGAMSGGSGEQALFTAAAVQMSRFYDLPHSTIAGATDSKIADAQSGYEKALTVALAAHAGSNMITQASGMQGSLMACSFESFVIDNDMLGAILRSLAPAESIDEVSIKEQIKSVVFGEGHYLASAETRQRMKSDFLYPRIADRRSHSEWEKDGSMDIRMRAGKVAKDLLKDHWPTHISEQADRKTGMNWISALRPGIESE